MAPGGGAQRTDRRLLRAGIAARAQRFSGRNKEQAPRRHIAMGWPVPLKRKPGLRNPRGQAQVKPQIAAGRQVTLDLVRQHKALHLDRNRGHVMPDFDMGECAGIIVHAG